MQVRGLNPCIRVCSCAPPEGEDGGTWTTDALLAETDFVLALARKLARNIDDAEDIAQQTWLIVLQRNPPRQRPLRAWLAGVVTNVAAQRRQSEVRRAWEEEHASIEHGVSSTHDAGWESLHNEDIKLALRSLVEPYRSILELRFFDDLTPRRIAVVLGLPVETVRTRLRRGLALLRRHAVMRR